MDHTESTSFHKSTPFTLNELTNSSLITNGAHILYMFDEHHTYIKNAISYIREGLDKGHRIVLFEGQAFFEFVTSSLFEKGYSEKTLKEITFIDHSRHYSTTSHFQADFSFENLVKLIEPTIEQHRTTRIWGQVLAQNAPLSELRQYECACDEFLRRAKVLSVCSYNALITPAYIQNELLKVHEYFMIDEKLEKSPFYNKKYVSNISPTELIRLQKIETENQELKKKNSQLLKEQANQIQRELILQEKKKNAEQASAMKTAFLSQMSHDLRTPLNVIQGYSQVLLLENSDTLLQSRVQKIFDSSNNLLKLIEEILDFSAIEAGKVNINKEYIHAKSFIDQCVKSIFETFQTNLIIQVEHIDNHIYIEADQLRLSQVLTNLITNAIKYNQPNGEITISIAHHSKEDTVTIKIEDTGIGIPSNELPLIFDPFYRSKKTMSKWKGTGIGLAIVAQLTSIMNGTYGVTSKVGIGSTFWVSFKGVVVKRSALDFPDQKSILDEHPTNAKMRILYIEDNLDNIDLMSSMLQTITPVQLFKELTGELGYQKAIDLEPDLILLDLHLPDITGLEVLSNLKCHPLTKSIPVIMISAEALESTIDLSIKKGCQDYLTKPIQLDELRNAILKNNEKSLV